VILSSDGVLPNPLPKTGTHPGIVSTTATTLRDSERSLILQTVAEVRWVIGGPKGAAAKLGLKRTTLIHKMQKLGIYRPSLPAIRDVIANDSCSRMTSTFAQLRKPDYRPQDYLLPLRGPLVDS